MAYFIEGNNKRVVYIANPRTGSTAVANALLAMGAESYGGHHDDPKEEWLTEGTLVVMNIRHHCDVITSYWYSRSKGRPIAELVDIIVSGEHQRFPPEGLYTRYSNFYLEHRTLQYEFDNMCLIAGLEETKLEQTRTDRPEDVTWESLFTPAMVKKVRDYYGEEMERLGYGGS